MKASIMIVAIVSLIVAGCSTTTHFSLKQTYPEYIEKELNKVERDIGVGVELSLLLSNGNEVNGELLSVRDSIMILCAEYSATEEELAKLTYPVSLISNNEIQQLTIEGSSWVWEGIAAGAVAGVVSYYFGHAIITYSNQEDSEEGRQLYGILFSLCIAAGLGIGYALSTEEYVLQEIPSDYDWFILKPLSRYPDKEPEYLRAIE